MSLRKFLAGQNSRDEVAIMKNRCTSTMTLAFLLCFYYALAVFAAIGVILNKFQIVAESTFSGMGVLEKICDRHEPSGITVRWKERVLTPRSTGWRFRFVYGDLGFFLKLFQTPRKRRLSHELADLTLLVRFH